MELSGIKTGRREGDRRANGDDRSYYDAPRYLEIEATLAETLPIVERDDKIS